MAKTVQKKKTKAKTQPQEVRPKEMVERLLRDFPLSRGTFEYEDYAAAPTRGNASDFITRALEETGRRRSSQTAT